MTATCSEFLQEVAEVFSGKVVICIDELDKITEIAQLFELLKGIKGILGQDNTHFILTVSEDAMAFFNERLSRERSLIESSFEEIVYLDRLSCGLARNVICQSLGMMYVEEEPFLRNSLMLWLFAAGIPREIKRHLFTCYANGVNIRTDSPIAVWRLLYLAMLNSMLTTTAPKEVAGLDEQYKFLICIEAIIGLVGSTSEATASNDFIGEVTSILASYFGQSFHRLLEPRRTDQARTGKDDEIAHNELLWPAGRDADRGPSLCNRRPRRRKEGKSIKFGLDDLRLQIRADKRTVRVLRAEQLLAYQAAGIRRGSQRAAVVAARADRSRDG